MGLQQNADNIADKAIDGAGRADRFVIALAGPPGVGKSTLSEALVAALARRGHRGAIVPMDGFHLDNAVLEVRGRRDRKGAPFTFDADGYAELLRRLRAAPEKNIAIPVFDRELDLARAGGRIIAPDHRFLIAEGNYLLLKEKPWADMAELFDLTVMLKVGPDELRRRLIDRWLGYGLGPEQALARSLSNDIPNAELVMTGSRTADLVLASDC